jgi:hypothetical protein
MTAKLFQFLFIIPAAFALTALACNAGETGGESGKTYDNPFAYCKAVGTIDSPGIEYTGPRVPEPIAKALKKQWGSPDSAPLETFIKGTYWRCMDGKVYACNVGANLPCGEKADVSKEPTQGMKDYCKENAGSDFIPMYVTGHSTIYDWKCDGTTPVAGKKLTEVDKQGYQKGIWYEIQPSE